MGELPLARKACWRYFGAWAYVIKDKRICKGDRHDDAQETILALKLVVLDCDNGWPSADARAGRTGSGTRGTADGETDAKTRRRPGPAVVRKDYGNQ